jgi:hypothetical protein
VAAELGIQGFLLLVHRVVKWTNRDDIPHTAGIVIVGGEKLKLSILTSSVELFESCAAAFAPCPCAANCKTVNIAHNAKQNSGFCLISIFPLLKLILFFTIHYPLFFALHASV